MIEIEYPDKLIGSELDNYLAKGFFRACNAMHQSEIVCTGEDILSPINVRLPLRDYKFSKSLRRLLRKNSERFRVEHGEPEFGETVAELYQNMKDRFQGFLCDDPKVALFGEKVESPFSTRMYRVYEEDELVACSFYDIGDNSVASIMGLYNTEYMSYGLGKFTMLLELQQALKEGREYYYPGYIFSTDTRMDYKLSLGNFEFRLPESNQWETLLVSTDKQPEDRLDTKGAVWLNTLLKEKISLIEAKLTAIGLPSEKIIYPLYDIRNLQLEGFENIRYPLVLKVLDHYYVEYDRDTRKYILFKGNYAHGPINEIMLEENMFDGESCYRENFIGYERVLFSHKSENAIAQIVYSFVLGLKQALLNQNHAISHDPPSDNSCERIA